MGNQHEKPPGACRAVNPIYSHEKITAALQHGQGHEADVQRGGGRKFNACHYGELSYQESQMCGQGGLGLGMPQRGFVQSEMGTSPPCKFNRLRTSQMWLPDIPGVYDREGSELPQNMGRPEKRVCFIVWEINDFNN